MYAGDLSQDINERDLFELFGLNKTSYFRDSSDVQIPLSENTGGFAYTTLPKHVSDKLKAPLKT